MASSTTTENEGPPAGATEVGPMSTVEVLKHIWQRTVGRFGDEDSTDE